MTINIGTPELTLLRARLESLESRLREETSAHARTRELLDEKATLEEEADLLRLVIENMPVMMNAFDEDGVCVAWNVECERITGYGASEMIGNPDVPDLVMPDPVYRARMMELWPSKQNTRGWEVDLTSKDGRRLTIAWSNISENCPIPGWAMWAVGVDVTERNRALEKLREVRRGVEELVRQRTAELETANELLRHQVTKQDRFGEVLKGRMQLLQCVLSSITDRVVTINESGAIETFTPAAEEMFGLTEKDVIGRSVAVLMPDPAETNALITSKRTEIPDKTIHSGSAPER